LRVTSKVGYLSTELPIALKLAIMQYSTLLYDNRGDCSSDAMPDVILNIISPFVVGGNYG
jgi:hypothetical protein